MPPLRPALAQSESKARFFERLSLDERNETHRRIYAMMKEEAVEGRRRISASQDVLAPSLRGQANIEPPYSNAQINETVIHREVLRIYAQARPETRYFYDMGRDTDRVEEENWVIRWMLWHVFRYRDSRNRHRRGTQSPSPTRTRTTPVVAQASVSESRTEGGKTMSELMTSLATNKPQSYYWDPVRNRWCIRE